jgi:hypothetical protein
MEFNGLFSETNILFPEITIDVGVYPHSNTTHLGDNTIPSWLTVKNVHIIRDGIQCCQVMFYYQDGFSLTGQFSDNLMAYNLWRTSTSCGSSK